MSVWHAVRDGRVAAEPAHVLGLPSAEFRAYRLAGSADVWALSNPDAPPYALGLPAQNTRWPHRVALALAFARRRDVLGPPPPPDCEHLPWLRELWETRKGAARRLLAHDLVFTAGSEAWVAARLARGATRLYVNFVALGVDTFSHEFGQVLGRVSYGEVVEL